MTVRKPKPESAARILMRVLSKMGFPVKYTQAKEALAQSQGFQNTHAQRAHESATKKTGATRWGCPKCNPTGKWTVEYHNTGHCHCEDLEGSCLVIRLGQLPLTAEDLEKMEEADDIRAVVELDQNDLFNLDLDGFLDLMSERITGSLYGLTDISYQAVSIEGTSPGVVTFEITAGAIEWETIDRPSSQGPSRTLAALEFIPQQFNDVVAVDFDGNLFKWLDEDRSASEDEGDLEVIKYEYDGRSGVNSLTIEDLVNARLDTDGKLTLVDGTELYLIDQNRQRWTPKSPATQTGRVSGTQRNEAAKPQAREELVPVFIAHFADVFRHQPDSMTARLLRKAAKDGLKEGLISKATHDGFFNETKNIIEAWRATPQGQPDATKPFYGCELPHEIKLLELVSTDARAGSWSNPRPVSFYDPQMLAWLETGMTQEISDRDLSDEVLVYEAPGGRETSLFGSELLEATLDKEGRFELKDGTEFYLIDETGKRWFPKDRV